MTSTYFTEPQFATEKPTIKLTVLRWIPFATIMSLNKEKADKVVQSIEQQDYREILNTYVYQLAQYINKDGLSDSSIERCRFTIRCILKRHPLVGDGSGVSKWDEDEIFKRAFIMVMMIRRAWDIKLHKRRLLSKKRKLDEEETPEELALTEQIITQINNDIDMESMSKRLDTFPIGRLKMDYDPNSEKQRRCIACLQDFQQNDMVLYCQNQECGQTLHFGCWDKSTVNGDVNITSCSVCRQRNNWYIGFIPAILTIVSTFWREHHDAFLDQVGFKMEAIESILTSPDYNNRTGEITDFISDYIGGSIDINTLELKEDVVDILRLNMPDAVDTLRNHIYNIPLYEFKEADVMDLQPDNGYINIHIAGMNRRIYVHHLEHCEPNQAGKDSAVLTETSGDLDNCTNSSVPIEDRSGRIISQMEISEITSHVFLRSGEVSTLYYHGSDETHYHSLLSGITLTPPTSRSYTDFSNRGAFYLDKDLNNTKNYVQHLLSKWNRCHNHPSNGHPPRRLIAGFKLTDEVLHQNEPNKAFPNHQDMTSDEVNEWHSLVKSMRTRNPTQQSRSITYEYRKHHWISGPRLYNNYQNWIPVMGPDQLAVRTEDMCWELDECLCAIVVYHDEKKANLSHVKSFG